MLSRTDWGTSLHDNPLSNFRLVGLKPTAVPIAPPPQSVLYIWPAVVSIDLEYVYEAWKSNPWDSRLTARTWSPLYQEFEGEVMNNALVKKGLIRHGYGKPVVPFAVIVVVGVIGLPPLTPGRIRGCVTPLTEVRALFWHPTSPLLTLNVGTVLGGSWPFTRLLGTTGFPSTSANRLMPRLPTYETCRPIPPGSCCSTVRLYCKTCGFLRLGSFICRAFPNCERPKSVALGFPLTSTRGSAKGLADCATWV